MTESTPRQATPSDLDHVRAVVDAAYDKYLARMDRPPAPLIHDYTTDIEARTRWVIGNPIVGLISVRRDLDSLLIENVAVHPSAQGRGIGRKLMALAEDEARRRVLLRLTLYTNEAMTDNISLYEHLGYIEMERRTDDGYRRVFMEKDLRE
jgi:ribosomal protein S18 acetylase RimI-like enzyme